MAKILSISSQVVHGFVGNNIMQFVLQRLGHEIMTLPTVLLSNHAGHKIFGGARLRSKTLRPVLEALEFAGHLKSVDAVMTGYLPGKEQVFVALDALKLVRKLNKNVLYLCDPTLGDDARPGCPEGLYIDVQAAECQRMELLPHADIITPNRFELEWLAMRPVMDHKSALAVMQGLNIASVLATSIPGKSGQLMNLLTGESQTLMTQVESLDPVPQGTGDLLTALYLGALLNKKPPEQALGFATAGVDAVVRESLGKEELDIVGTQDLWNSAEPFPAAKVEHSAV